MVQQHYLSQAQYEVDKAEPLPTAADLEQPQEPTAAPYFTSWLRPQILRAMGWGRPGVPQSVAEYRAYYGGLKIKTTLDLRMQQAADQAISQDLPYAKGGIVASLVAIDNSTGQVRAMVGGPIINGHEDYQQYPFNLATEGRAPARVGVQAVHPGGGPGVRLRPRFGLPVRPRPIRGAQQRR